MHIAIHLNAGNDTNGNPRRLYVVYSVAERESELMAVIREGYSGVRALRERFPDAVLLSGAIQVTAKEYRSYLGMKSYTVGVDGG